MQRKQTSNWLIESKLGRGGTGDVWFRSGWIVGFGFAVLFVFAVVNLTPGTKNEARGEIAHGSFRVNSESLRMPPADEGTISGRVFFEGQPPKLMPIRMEADAVCAAQHLEPVYVEGGMVNDNGTLPNVVVYVKSGLGNLEFAAPGEPVLLNQQGCVFRPHVLGMRVGQSLEVMNSDSTTHNVHPLPRYNREWNMSQPPDGEPIIKTFTRPEVLIPVKCNQHPWMKAYIGVLSHPYFAVTEDDGAFEIKGLPSGEYEIEAWHEQYGALTQKVTVRPGEMKSIDFTYMTEQTYHPGSLQMAPALVLSCCGKE